MGKSRIRTSKYPVLSPSPSGNSLSPVHLRCLNWRQISPNFRNLTARWRISHWISQSYWAETWKSHLRESKLVTYMTHVGPLLQWGIIVRSTVCAPFFFIRYHHDCALVNPHVF